MFFFFLFFFSGAGTETGPVRQRFPNSTRRDSQLYQISFVDGRIGSVNVERAAHHPHRIPVSFILLLFVVVVVEAQLVLLQLFFFF